MFGTAVARRETKSNYCRVARQALPCYTAVARLGFKRRTAKVEFNSIRIEFGTVVARPLKQALELFSGRLPVKIVKTLNDRQFTLLAESLRSFLDNTEISRERRKRKGEKGKRKEERGKRKEERGKTKLRKVVSVTKQCFVL